MKFVNRIGDKDRVRKGKDRVVMLTKNEVQSLSSEVLRETLGVCLTLSHSFATVGGGK